MITEKITDYPRLSEVFESETLFNFSYPKGEDFETIQDMIYNHYASYRLCAKYPTEWRKKYFAPRINEIMPMFNKMYESAELITLPLRTMHYTETESGSDSENVERGGTIVNESEQSMANSGYNNNSTKSNSSGTSKATDSGSDTTAKTNKFSDTPQGAVANLTDGYLTNVTLDSGETSYGKVQDVENATENTGVSNDSYLNTQNDTGKTTTTDTRTNERTKEYGKVTTVDGYKGNQAELLKSYRETLININSELLNCLTDLFLQVYDWEEDE